MIKKQAKSKNFIISQHDDKTIEIRVKNGKNHKILREIAKEVGFELSKEWTTQQLGSKLIGFLKEK